MAVVFHLKWNSLRSFRSIHDLIGCSTTSSSPKLPPIDYSETSNAKGERKSPGREDGNERWCNSSHSSKSWRSKKSRFYDHDYCLSPSHVPKLTSFHRISPIIDHASQHGSSTSGYIRSRKRCQNLQCGPLLNEHFHRQSYTIGQLVQKALGILFAKGIDQEMEFSKL
ncbi:hypothetical protein MJO29_016011 [Puccinia striiformis f. sp. tritici]|nr:hypothetical protein MJO29_016011 [Puccinia striiformis f. sp. tritici]